ncbi:LysM domain-containing protein [Ralstonia sp. UNC404CL21Col]|uniref:LysM peptidoglycan-binding domain-containing protein n=1 Tax=Ralstonia sp. UNC404CL21Col TaxID=1380362 RepID=UPI00048680B8|nr:LysM domain-containing protein [Ralstonia sp. UNC404CL21Col]
MGPNWPDGIKPPDSVLQAQREAQAAYARAQEQAAAAQRQKAAEDAHKATVDQLGKLKQAGNPTALNQAVSAEMAALYTQAHNTPYNSADAKQFAEALALLQSAHDKGSADTLFASACADAAIDRANKAVNGPKQDYAAAMRSLAGDLDVNHATPDVLNFTLGDTRTRDIANHARGSSADDLKNIAQSITRPDANAPELLAMLVDQQPLETLTNQSVRSSDPAAKHDALLNDLMFISQRLQGARKTSYSPSGEELNDRLAQSLAHRLENDPLVDYTGNHLDTQGETFGIKQLVDKGADPTLMFKVADQIGRDGQAGKLNSRVESLFEGGTRNILLKELAGKTHDKPIQAPVAAPINPTQIQQITGKMLSNLPGNGTTLAPGVDPLQYAAILTRLQAGAHADPTAFQTAATAAQEQLKPEDPHIDANQRTDDAIGQVSNLHLFADTPAPAIHQLLDATPAQQDSPALQADRHQTDQAWNDLTQAQIRQKQAADSHGDVTSANQALATATTAYNKAVVQELKDTYPQIPGDDLLRYGLSGVYQNDLQAAVQQLYQHHDAQVPQLSGTYLQAAIVTELVDNTMRSTPPGQGAEAPEFKGLEALKQYTAAMDNAPGGNTVRDAILGDSRIQHMRQNVVNTVIDPVRGEPQDRIKALDQMSHMLSSYLPVDFDHAIQNAVENDPTVQHMVDETARLTTTLPPADGIARTADLLDSLDTTPNLMARLYAVIDPPGGKPPSAMMNWIANHPRDQKAVDYYRNLARIGNRLFNGGLILGNGENALVDGYGRLVHAFQQRLTGDKPVLSDYGGTEAGMLSVDTNLMPTISKALEAGAPPKLFLSALNGYSYRDKTGAMTQAAAGIAPTDRVVDPMNMALKDAKGGAASDDSPAAKVNQSFSSEFQQLAKASGLAPRSFATFSDFSDYVGQQAGISARTPVTAADWQAVHDGTFRYYDPNQLVYRNQDGSGTTLDDLARAAWQAGGGDTGPVTVTGLTFVLAEGSNDPQQSVLLDVRRDGHDRYVSASTDKAHKTRVYDSWSDWVSNNDFGIGQVSYLVGGQATFDDQGNAMALVATHETGHEPWLTPETAIMISAAVVSMVAAPFAAPEMVLLAMAARGTMFAIGAMQTSEAAVRVLEHPDNAAAWADAGFALLMTATDGIGTLGKIGRVGMIGRTADDARALERWLAARPVKGFADEVNTFAEDVGRTPLFKVAKYGSMAGMGWNMIQTGAQWNQMTHQQRAVAIGQTFGFLAAGMIEQPGEALMLRKVARRNGNAVGTTYAPMNDEQATAADALLDQLHQWMPKPGEGLHPVVAKLGADAFDHLRDALAGRQLDAPAVRALGQLAAMTNEAGALANTTVPVAALSGNVIQLDGDPHDKAAHTEPEVLPSDRPRRYGTPGLHFEDLADPRVLARERVAILDDLHEEINRLYLYSGEPHAGMGMVVSRSTPEEVQQHGLDARQIHRNVTAFGLLMHMEPDEYLYLLPLGNLRVSDEPVAGRRTENGRPVADGLPVASMQPASKILGYIPSATASQGGPRIELNYDPAGSMQPYDGSLAFLPTVYRAACADTPHINLIDPEFPDSAPFLMHFPQRPANLSGVPTDVPIPYGSPAPGKSGITPAYVIAGEVEHHGIWLDVKSAYGSIDDVPAGLPMRQSDHGPQVRLDGVALAERVWNDQTFSMETTSHIVVLGCDTRSGTAPPLLVNLSNELSNRIRQRRSADGQIADPRPGIRVQGQDGLDWLQLSDGAQDGRRHVINAHFDGQTHGIVALPVISHADALYAKTKERLRMLYDGDEPVFPEGDRMMLLLDEAHSQIAAANDLAQHGTPSGAYRTASDPLELLVGSPASHVADAVNQRPFADACNQILSLLNADLPSSVLRMRIADVLGRVVAHPHLTYKREVPAMPALGKPRPVTLTLHAKGAPDPATPAVLVNGRPAYDCTAWDDLPAQPLLVNASTAFHDNMHFPAGMVGAAFDGHGPIVNSADNALLTPFDIARALIDTPFDQIRFEGTTRTRDVGTDGAMLTLRRVMEMNPEMEVPGFFVALQHGGAIMPEVARWLAFLLKRDNVRVFGLDGQRAPLSGGVLRDPETGKPTSERVRTVHEDGTEGRIVLYTAKDGSDTPALPSMIKPRTADIGAKAIGGMRYALPEDVLIVEGKLLDGDPNAIWLDGIVEKNGRTEPSIFSSSELAELISARLWAKGFENADAVPVVLMVDNGLKLSQRLSEAMPNPVFATEHKIDRSQIHNPDCRVVPTHPDDPAFAAARQPGWKLDPNGRAWPPSEETPYVPPTEASSEPRTPQATRETPPDEMPGDPDVITLDSGGGPSASQPASSSGGTSQSPTSQPVPADKPLSRFKRVTRGVQDLPARAAVGAMAGPRRMLALMPMRTAAARVERGRALHVSGENFHQVAMSHSNGALDSTRHFTYAFARNENGPDTLLGQVVFDDKGVPSWRALDAGKRHFDGLVPMADSPLGARTSYTPETLFVVSQRPPAEVAIDQSVKELGRKRTYRGAGLAESDKASVRPELAAIVDTAGTQGSKIKERGIRNVDAPGLAAVTKRSRQNSDLPLPARIRRTFKESLFVMRDYPTVGLLREQTALKLLENACRVLGVPFPRKLAQHFSVASTADRRAVRAYLNLPHKEQDLVTLAARTISPSNIETAGEALLCKNIGVITEIRVVAAESMLSAAGLGRPLTHVRRMWQAAMREHGNVSFDENVGGLVNKDGVMVVALDWLNQDSVNKMLDFSAKTGAQVTLWMDPANMRVGTDGRPVPGPNRPINMVRFGKAYEAWMLDNPGKHPTVNVFGTGNDNVLDPVEGIASLKVARTLLDSPYMTDVHIALDGTSDYTRSQELTRATAELILENDNWKRIHFDAALGRPLNRLTKEDMSILYEPLMNQVREVIDERNLQVKFEDVRRALFAENTTHRVEQAKYSTIQWARSNRDALGVQSNPRADAHAQRWLDEHGDRVQRSHVAPAEPAHDAVLTDWDGLMTDPELDPARYQQHRDLTPIPVAEDDADAMLRALGYGPMRAPTKLLQRTDAPSAYGSLNQRALLQIGKAVAAGAGGAALSALLVSLGKVDLRDSASLARALPAFGRTAQQWRAILSSSIQRGDTAMIENKLIAYYAGIERYAKARDVSPERLPHIRAVMEETLAAIGMLRDRAKPGAQPRLSEEERDTHIARVTSTCLQLVDGYLGLPASQMHFMHSGVRSGQLGRLASTVGGVVGVGAWGGMMLEGVVPPALAITMMAGSTLNAFYHGLLRYSFRRGFDFNNSDVVRSLVHGAYTLSSTGTIVSAMTHPPSVAGAVSVGGSVIYLMSTLKAVVPNFMPGVIRASAGLTALAETTALISAWINSGQGAQPVQPNQPPQQTGPAQPPPHTPVLPPPPPVPPAPVTHLVPAVTHDVLAGESLSRILRNEANRGTIVVGPTYRELEAVIDEVARLNQLANPDLIHIGQNLIIVPAHQAPGPG